MPKEFLTLFHFQGIISLSRPGGQCFLQEPKTHHRAWEEAVDQVYLRCSLIADHCNGTWLLLRGWREVPIARDTMPFRTDLNASSQRTTFLGTRRSHVRFRINQSPGLPSNDTDVPQQWLVELPSNTRSFTLKGSPTWLPKCDRTRATTEMPTWMRQGPWGLKPKQKTTDD